ncbi:hypothetical protein HID58_040996 [Brassica napus]|uniref:Reverse transcriptase zinc-binding domain-containing protein n=1 Tax=Brassica napus TaxID=3708 RepID=A0ABQ8BAS2_BRANA|nr:hypothetical protein HID58_040996 [Brassica napus]
MDRLLSWGLDVEGICLLCGTHQESRNHLFFECAFSAEVWRAALLRLRVYNAPTSWESVIDWLSAFSGDRQHKLVVLQIWQRCLSKAVALKNSGRKLGTDLVSFWSVA